MQKLCKRCASTAARRHTSVETPTPSVEGTRIRDVLASARKLRNSPSIENEPEKKSFGIRQLVRARSAGFKSEIGKLTNEEYRQTPIRARLRQHFKDESTQELLQSTQDSPDLQRKLLAQGVQEESTSQEVEEIEDFSAAGLLEANDYSAVVLLNQGDLVEYWPDQGERRTAIILRQPEASTGKRYVIITDRGRIDYANPNRFRFVLPNFYTHSEISKEGLIQQDDPAFIPLRRAIKTFKEDANSFAARNARVFDNIYEQLPQLSKKHSAVVSSADVCRKLFGETTQAQLYATFEAMMRDRKHFLPDATMHMSIPYFVTRAPKDIDMIDKVTRWTRAKTPEYSNFITRAKEIAAIGETITSELNGSLKAVRPDTKFVGTDTIFIDFMIKACLERPDRPETELYTTPVSMIVKALNFFPGQKADRRVVHASLKKMGILAPWDSNLKRLEAVALPGQGASHQADQYLNYENVHFAHNKLETLTKLGLEDRSDSVRHDFGLLPVYAIDGIGASELDDGISIEGDWLHVHIADPSSFIRPGSKLAEIAAFRVATTYSVDQNYPMLPSALTSKHFSLGGANMNPAMTTSTRINDKGEIVEVLIRPSIIRNVKKATYEDIDETVFKLKPRSHIISDLSVNWDRNIAKEISARTDLAQLTDDDMTNLNSIHELLKKVRGRRFEQGMIDFYNTEHQTQIQPSHLPDTTKDYAIPIFYAGRPGISTMTMSQSVSYSRNLVQEAAILTNGAIAQFASERNIPIIFRTMESRLNDEEKARVYALRDKQGRVRFEDIQDVLQKLGTARMSLECGPADILGLPNGYTHATSPLRRYVDMVAQWQIQSYLLKRPYEVNLKEILPLLIRRGKAMKRLDRANSQHWLIQLLQQKMERGEKLEFEATVRTNNARLHFPSEGIIKVLGQRVLIRRQATDPEMALGSKVKIQVEELDLMDNVIYARRCE